ncbi:SDR family NAD(P)-dependent oxidoreductase [Paracandidimonas soli]|uniref:NAD(P)-dependent dehydrogenase (Short-subunit alcohol dehydrogenase family) n=1 Tax=Paracandidimonas soli TaxID=1917182 RepID=A0A4R3UX04_9BURK|nr:SDR family NAD(P)-dependent oxidoreductase [Paracandidimonas soli]TCU94484.1 hypothetical protein EV686_10935 [Paracandidimonas soli]
MGDRLQGKIALVSGAGSAGPGWGNGRAIAYRFAQEGATVFAADLKPEALTETVERIDELGGTVRTHLADVTKFDQVQEMVDTCLAEFGRIDILVNNVGGSKKGGPVELSETDWNAQIDYNLKSVYLGCKAVLPHMIAQNGGAIVNLSSTSGIRWTGSAQVGYASAKAGIIQLSRVVALQHAQQNIRCNTVVPGQMHTPMVEARLAGQRASGDVDTLLAQRQARIPLPFMGTGIDTANAVLFLASDEARFITATEIVVDGGMSARCD